jgi:hypothetical protein
MHTGARRKNAHAVAAISSRARPSAIIPTIVMKIVK